MLVRVEMQIFEMTEVFRILRVTIQTDTLGKRTWIFVWWVLFSLNPVCSNIFWKTGDLDPSMNLWQGISTPWQTRVQSVKQGWAMCSAKSLTRPLLGFSSDSFDGLLSEFITMVKLSSNESEITNINLVLIFHKFWPHLNTTLAQLITRQLADPEIRVKTPPGSNWYEQIYLSIICCIFVAHVVDKWYMVWTVGVSGRKVGQHLGFP